LALTITDSIDNTWALAVLRADLAGKELAKAAQGVRSEWLNFEQSVQGIKGAESGLLRVGMVNTAQYFAPRMLGSFCAARPKVEVAMALLNRDGVIERLRANQDDLYIMSRPPENLALTCQPFMPNPLVVVAPRGHALAKRGKLRPEDLAADRFIARETGSGTRLAVDDFFRPLKNVPEVRFELGSNEAILEAVAGGMGLAIVSAHALRASARTDIITLEVEGFPLQSSWQIVHPSGRRLSPLAAAFRDHLIAQAGPLMAVT
jgi:DNA-binding transcriptional LysR family regulator